MSGDNQQGVWDQRYRIRRNHHPRLVAEGDSWFAYPMWRNMMDCVDAQSGRFAICRCGESGRRLSEIVQQGRYLDRTRQEHPLLVLISGSGNDFVNRSFVTGADGGQPIFNRYQPGMTEADLINADKWQRKLDELHTLFETLLQRVGGAAPVITHGYDYIVPSPNGAVYDGIHVAGPWIQPTMHAQGIDDPVLQRRIGVLLIDSLNDMLGGLHAEHPTTFIHVDLRGVLVSSDWANEIHPYEDGFATLAARLLKAIDSALEPPAPPIAEQDTGGIQ
jgi:hypothetical protein